MLEIKFEATDGNTSHDHNIIVNGVKDSDSYCFKIDETIYFCHLGDLKVFDLLSEHNFEDVANYLSTFDYTFKSLPEKLDYLVEVECTNEEDYGTGVYVRFSFIADLWARPYSISQFEKIFKQVAEAETKKGIRYKAQDEDNLLDGFGIFLSSSDQRAIIKDVITKAVDTFKDLEASSEIIAIDSLDKDYLTTYFSFPEDIKVAAKQYLVYFAQFLLDLGIEAETEVRETKGQTLFKVIPANKGEALEQIRGALETYLNAPAADDLEIQPSQSFDVAAM
jgi:hypothetical protein